MDASNDCGCDGKLGSCLPETGPKIQSLGATGAQGPTCSAGVAPSAVPATASALIDHLSERHAALKRAVWCYLYDKVTIGMTPKKEQDSLEQLAKLVAFDYER